MHTLFNPDRFLVADVTFKLPIAEDVHQEAEEINYRMTLQRSRSPSYKEDWGNSLASPAYEAYTGKPLDCRIGVGAIARGQSSDGRSIKIKIKAIKPPGFQIVANAIGETIIVEILERGVMV